MYDGPAMSTAIHRHVDEARSGGARVIARMASGWAVMGESQLLPGYSLLLPDPVVASLNDLSPGGRAVYLDEMSLLGDAVARASAVKPRRINYEILGNLEPALHAHVIPRFESEPEAMRTKAIWLYPPEMWNAPEHRFDARNPSHAKMREGLRAAVEAIRAERAGSAGGTPATVPGMFQRACSFAARAHDGHLRKDGRTPYIAHPFRVAMIVRDAFGCSDCVALASAVLHDTIEDTRTDYDDLVVAFGAEVASIVAALSKDKRLPEEERERAYDEGLARADWRARMVKLADVMDNREDPWGGPDDAETTRSVYRERVRRVLAIASPLAGSHPCLDRAIALLSLPFA